jgi:hypothetical protein
MGRVVLKLALRGNDGSGLRAMSKGKSKKRCILHGRPKEACKPLYIPISWRKNMGSGSKIAIWIEEHGGITCDIT